MYKFKYEKLRLSTKKLIIAILSTITILFLNTFLISNKTSSIIKYANRSHSEVGYLTSRLTELKSDIFYLRVTLLVVIFQSVLIYISTRKEGYKNMNKCIIRQEEKIDRLEVYQVIKEAFAYEKYSDGDEQDLVERLRGSDEFVAELSFVAYLEGEIIGHILFTEIKIGGATALALAPVSVLPKYQSKGVGRKLIERGHAMAKKLGYTAVVLLGHESYYPKFGYKKASDYGIVAPFEVPDENFMVLELKENSLREISGLVEYSSKFFKA